MGPRHDAVSNRLRPPPGVLEGEHRVHSTAQTALPNPAVHAQAAAGGHEFHRCPLSLQPPGEAPAGAGPSSASSSGVSPSRGTAPGRRSGIPALSMGAARRMTTTSGPCGTRLAARATAWYECGDARPRRADGGPNALVERGGGWGVNSRTSTAWGRQVTVRTPPWLALIIRASAAADARAAKMRRLKSHASKPAP
jgi:hypothetical protein